MSDRSHFIPNGTYVLSKKYQIKYYSFPIMVSQEIMQIDSYLFVISSIWVI